MTIHRPRDWPDGQSSNTPSSASSFGFDVAAELARMTHPSTRADLRAMPPHGDVEVGRFPMPSSAVGLGAVTSGRRPAGDRWIALAVGFVLGRITRH